MTLDEVLAWAVADAGRRVDGDGCRAERRACSSRASRWTTSTSTAAARRVHARVARPRPASVAAGPDRRRPGYSARAVAGAAGRAGDRLRRRRHPLRSSPISTPPGSTSSGPGSTRVPLREPPDRRHAPRRPADDLAVPRRNATGRARCRRPSSLGARSHCSASGRARGRSRPSRSARRHRRRPRRRRTGLGDGRHLPHVDARCPRATPGSRSPRARSTRTSPRRGRTRSSATISIRCGSRRRSATPSTLARVSRRPSPRRRRR